MPNLQAITRETFQHKRFKPVTDYKFTAQETVAPLVVQELPKALLSLPIVFMPSADGFVLRALQGFEPGKNLLIAANGRWLGRYIPSAYRGYPFVLAELAGDSGGKKVLCFDEDSGLLETSTDVDGGIGGIGPVGKDGNKGNKGTKGNKVGVAKESEAFFKENGELGTTVAQTLNFLDQVDKNRLITQNICAVLQRHALLEPWPISVQIEAGTSKVQGLYRIKELALGQLSSHALVELRDTGALLAAYCQLLSMQQLSMLAEIAQAHAKVALMAKAQQPTPPPASDLNLDFMSKGSAINFDHLFKK